MSVAITEWNLNHTHPHGSWWQYRNDRRYGEWSIVGLAVMAVVSTALTVWAVMAA